MAELEGTKLAKWLVHNRRTDVARNTIEDPLGRAVGLKRFCRRLLDQWEAAWEWEGSQ